MKRSIPEPRFPGSTAAEGALERILGRLKEAARADPPIEYRFTLTDEWSRKLSVALRRYNLKPYRYMRQRYNTVMVMVMVPVSFVDQTLWPEYIALNEALREHLEKVSTDIIALAVSRDTSEAEERRELASS